MSPELRATLEAWLYSDDPVQRSHAEHRLSAEAGPQGLPPASETIALLRLMHRCQYRSTAGCGCSGAKCAIRGAAVSHRDCLDCVRTYGAA